MNKSYRRCLIPTLLLTLTSAASAKERLSEPTEPLSLTVRTYNYTGKPESVLQPAKEVAAGVFRKLGIQLAWADCTPGGESAQTHPACQPRVVFETDVLNLKLISREMAERVRGQFPGDTFGFALPAQRDGFGSNATIFYHSVEEVAREAKRATATVLGHVLAHEMGHLLLGMKGHSRQGIMHIPWGPKEPRRTAIRRQTGATHSRTGSGSHGGGSQSYRGTLVSTARPNAIAFQAVSFQRRSRTDSRPGSPTNRPHPRGRGCASRAKSGWTQPQDLR